MAHTTGGSEKPTEESARERGLGVAVGRDSRYGSIYVCPPSPSLGPCESSLLRTKTTVPTKRHAPHIFFLFFCESSLRYLCAMYLRVFIVYTVKEKERDFQYDYFINKVRLPYC
jgi:hypothetical protein